jgi:hydrogenase maturation factor
LLKLGLTEAEISSGQSFLSQISILPEARLACKIKAATAIHDVTEGGLATAIEELSIAGGHCLKIDMDEIPVFPLTQKISDLLGIDPFGLIGSGSLLICCKENVCADLMRALYKNNINVACIGEVAEPGKGIKAYRNGSKVTWPHFKVDEITRLFGD